MSATRSGVLLLLLGCTGARADGWLRWEDSVGAEVVIDRGASDQPQGASLLLRPRATYNYRPLESDPAPFALWPYLQRRPSLTVGADLLGGVNEDPAPTTTSARLRQARWLLGANARLNLPFGPWGFLLGASYTHQQWRGEIAPSTVIDRDELGWQIAGEFAHDTLRFRFVHHGWVRHQRGEAPTPEVAHHVDGEIVVEAYAKRLLMGCSFLLGREASSDASRRELWITRWGGYLDIFAHRAVDILLELAIAPTSRDLRFLPGAALRVWPNSRLGLGLGYHGESRTVGVNRLIYTIDLSLSGRFR